MMKILNSRIREALRSPTLERLDKDGKPQKALIANLILILACHGINGA